MTVLVLSVFAVLVISGLCSLTEAAVYAVRMPYVRALAESGSQAGQLLLQFKQNMERPISTILIVNTVANTAGAAIAGAQARSVLPESALIGFAASFTLAVLVVSEIVPKVLGVVYSERLVGILAVPLHLAILSLYPLVWTIQQLSRWIKPDVPALAAPEEEVEQLARMSAEEGSILKEEAELVHHVLRLNEVTAGDIMTPRPVVVKFRAGLTVQELAERIEHWTYSRIPVYSDDDPETWVGYVLQRDVLTSLAEDRFGTTLASLCKPMFFVSERTPGHVLLRSFVRRKTHLFGVMNRFGDLIGVVTLEDVIESLIGQEIVDEVDSAVDMQDVARLRRRQQMRRQSSDREATSDSGETA
jgi:CBS domain containing-hemolysin-like protein